jgi:hypothetical protein
MMNIQDFDSGVKFRRPYWDEGTFLKWDCGKLVTNTCRVIIDMPVADALADDWEVVEEKQDIEVGDVVRHNSPACINTDCTVAYIDVSGDTHCLESELGCSDCTVHIDKLTLIRKGPKKHVFENVAIRPLVKYDAIPVQANNQQLYPMGYLDLKGNGKAYKMILEEMPDEGGK